MSYAIIKYVQEENVETSSGYLRGASWSTTTWVVVQQEVVRCYAGSCQSGARRRAVDEACDHFWIALALEVDYVWRMMARDWSEIHIQRPVLFWWVPYSDSNSKRNADASDMEG